MKNLYNEISFKIMKNFQQHGENNIFDDPTQGRWAALEARGATSNNTFTFVTVFSYGFSWFVIGVS